MAIALLFASLLFIILFIIFFNKKSSILLLFISSFSISILFYFLLTYHSSTYFLWYKTEGIVCGKFMSEYISNYKIKHNYFLKVEYSLSKSKRKETYKVPKEIYENTKIGDTNVPIRESELNRLLYVCCALYVFFSIILLVIKITNSI